LLSGGAVGPVDRRGVDFDEDLVVFGQRLGDVFEVENFGRPVASVDDRLHFSLVAYLAFGGLSERR
jgi:hypothetical protein